MWTGTAIDVVLDTATRTLYLSEALQPYGVTAPDVDDVLPTRTSVWLREDHVTVEPLTEARMEGTWVFRVVQPSDLPDLLDRAELGDPVIRHAFVTFASNNTAIASSPMLETDLSLNWQLLSDGTVELTYPDVTTQRIGIWAEVGEEIALVSWHDLGDDEVVVCDRAIELDAAPPAFSEGMLINESSQMWRSTVNFAATLPDADGLRPDWQYYGHAIHADGAMDRVWIEYTDPSEETGPFIYEEPWSWSTTATELSMWNNMDASGDYGCDPALDASCVPVMWRYWQPVKQAGDLLYVLEAYTWLPYDVLFDMEWDDVDQRWELEGAPANLDQKAYLIRPRLNAYFAEDIRTFN